MWYDKYDASKLDFKKPIFAQFPDFGNYVLLPQIEKSSYNVIGYNWFNIDDGKYNSCTCFKTVEEAVDSYKSFGYTIFNGELEIKK